MEEKVYQCYECGTPLIRTEQKVPKGFFSSWCCPNAAEHPNTENKCPFCGGQQHTDGSLNQYGEQFATVCTEDNCPSRG
jgi:hypothetical protein